MRSSTPRVSGPPTAWEDGEEEDEAPRFPDLDALAEECRFSDCAHVGTPGCALGQAVADGTLGRGRRDRYLAYVEERHARDEARASAARQRAATATVASAREP